MTKDIRKLNPHALRLSVTLIPQQPKLRGRTIGAQAIYNSEGSFSY
jgi:hypothetical protein